MWNETTSRTKTGYGQDKKAHRTGQLVLPNEKPEHMPLSANRIQKDDGCSCKVQVPGAFVRRDPRLYSGGRTQSHLGIILGYLRFATSRPRPFWNFQIPTLPRLESYQTQPDSLI